MFEFSNQTTKSLKESGWYPERHIDIEQYKDSILNSDYKFFPKVEAFLRQYGGLLIKFKVRNGIETSLNFDTIQAVEDIDPIWVQVNYYNLLKKTDLCVIGQAYTDHMTLMMDEDGRVYGGFDDYLCFIANSGEEAIEAICSNATFDKIT